MDPGAAVKAILDDILTMELASDLLLKAVKYDNDKRKVEALSLYTEGINKLLDVAKSKQQTHTGCKSISHGNLLFQLNWILPRNSTTTKRSKSS